MSATKVATKPTAAEIARAAVDEWLQRILSHVYALDAESAEAFDISDAKWAIYERLKEDERLPKDGEAPLEHGHLICALNAGYLLGVQVGQRIRPPASS